MSDRRPEIVVSPENVGRIIRAAREARGLSQRELARCVGSAPSLISRLESVRYTGHSVTSLRKLAAAMDCDLEIRFVARATAGCSQNRESGARVNS